MQFSPFVMANVGRHCVLNYILHIRYVSLSFCKPDNLDDYYWEVYQLIKEPKNKTRSRHYLGEWFDHTKAQ